MGVGLGVGCGRGVYSFYRGREEVGVATLPCLALPVVLITHVFCCSYHL